MLRRLALCFVAVLALFHGHAAAQPAIAQVHDGGVIRAIAVQADGKVIIGGSFQHVNGVERSNIARLNADLTLDMTWNPGANQQVYALAVDGAHVYAGGIFSHIGGNVNQLFLARISTSGSGATDTSWSVSPNGAVRALALDGAGGLHVAGAFTQIGTQGRNRLAKVSLASGLLDPTWNPGADGDVLALAYRAGALYAGGSFGVIGGQSRNRIAKLSASGTGAADATWNPAASATVIALANDAAGSVYAGGYFTSIGGAARNYVAKLSPSGPGAADATWNPAPDSSVAALLVAPEGSIYAGGSFNAIGGRTSPGVARLSSSSGAADPAFTGPGMNGEVGALQLASDGKLLAGGDFQRAGSSFGGGLCALSAASGTLVSPSIMLLTPGIVNTLAIDSVGRTVLGGKFIAMGDRSTTRANIARLLADGTLDPGWQPQADGQVRAIAFDGANNTFIGGEFNRIGATARLGLAKLDSQGQLVAGWAPGWSGTVYALAFDGANLFVGSYMLDRLVAATGAATSNFPVSTGGGFVYALVLDGGSLYLGGQFSTVGGVARNGLAKVSAASGAVDAQWNPSPGYVAALAAEGGSVYVGGLFTSIGGQSRRNLAKVSAVGTGAADIAWDPSPDGIVAAFAIGGGHLYLGGFFTTIGGQAASYLARTGLASAGTIDSQWRPEPQGALSATVYSQGTLHVGGRFLGLAAQPRVGYGTLAPNAAPNAPAIASITPGDSQLAVTLGSSQQVATGFPSTVTVTCNPGAVTGTHNTRLAMVRSLTNGTSYSCTATVTNVNGSSPASPPVSATPIAVNVAGLGRSSNGVPFIADVRAFLATCPDSSDPATAHVLAATRLTYDGVEMAAEPCTAPVDINAPPTARLQLLQLLRVAYYMDPGASGLYPWTPGTYWDWLRSKVSTIEIRAVAVSGFCCIPTLLELPGMVLAPPQPDVSLYLSALSRLIGLVSHEARHADGFPHASSCVAPGTSSCDPEYNVANLSAYGVAWYVANLFVTGQVNVGLGCNAEGRDFLQGQLGFQNNLRESQFNGAKPPIVTFPAQPGGPCRLQVDPATIPRLVNISTRGIVRTGDNVMIGGFIIGGSAPKTVVVRARGPSLTPLGVPGVLANPQVQLYSGQTLLAANDNWQQATNAPAITASGQAPTNANEAAILIQLNPGPYTAIVTGVGNGTGIGIVEVFEIDALAVPLINISTRGLVETGDNVLIGGFIIQGNGPQTVVVRARGPSLAQLGVPGVLANPQLQLYSGQALIASNDNWQQATNANAITASGQAPTNANEAAILMTLDPGAYTAIVTGVGGTTGVAIVEVFKVN